MVIPETQSVFHLVECKSLEIFSCINAVGMTYKTLSFVVQEIFSLRNIALTCNTFNIKHFVVK